MSSKAVGPIWLSSCQFAEIVSITFSIPINFLLLYCILTKSPKQFGKYKYFMAWFSGNSMFFSLLATFLHMSFHTFHGVFMIFSMNNYLNLPSWCMIVFLAMCCISFGFTLLILAIQFIYRYFAMNYPERLKHFSGLRLLFIPLAMITIIAIYTICAIISATLPIDRDMKLRDELSRAYQNTPEKFSYVAVEYFYRSDTDEITINWKSVFVGFTTTFVFLSMSVIIVYCGIKTYNAMYHKTSQLSNHLKIQRQLFTALVVQTVIPTILIFIPCFVFYALPLFEIPLGEYSNVLGISLVLYPVIDPIGVLYIIKDYRQTIKEFFYHRLIKNTRVYVNPEAGRESIEIEPK